MNPMYPKKGRVILHVDMNSFYASVEMACDPSLKGKPLAVAGNVEERRGIIVTCSYEAREFGVKTTMPLWEAKKLCPELIVKSPDFTRYRAASIGMFELLRQYTDLVEPVSIDEGYMDITESQQFGSPLEIARSIQTRLLNELDLPCSIGIAPNKFLAKMASNMKKPMGITVLRKRDVERVLWPLDTSEMHGIGKKTAEKLKTIGIKTIGELANGNEVQLKTLLGVVGSRLKERANGIDARLVSPESAAEFKSIGNSTTLPRDLANQQQLFTILDSLAERVAGRLKRKRVLASVLGVTIRYKDRKTITRSKTLTNPIQESEEISRFAKKLFLKHWNGDPVRLLGITTSDLTSQDEAVKQLDLFSFEKEAKKEPLLKVLSELREKYGAKIIGNAELHQDDPSNQDGTETSFNKDFLRPFFNRNKEE